MLPYSSIPALSDPAKNWTDLFVSQPWIFFRIFSALDLAITHGKLPERSSIFKDIDYCNLKSSMAPFPDFYMTPLDIFSVSSPPYSTPSMQPQHQGTDKGDASTLVDIQVSNTTSKAAWVDSALLDALECIPP